MRRGWPGSSAWPGLGGLVPPRRARRLPGGSTDRGAGRGRLHRVGTRLARGHGGPVRLRGRRRPTSAAVVHGGVADARRSAPRTCSAWSPCSGCWRGADPAGPGGAAAVRRTGLRSACSAWCSGSRARALTECPRLRPTAGFVPAGRPGEGLVRPGRCLPWPPWRSPSRPSGSSRWRPGWPPVRLAAPARPTARRPRAEPPVERPTGDRPVPGPRPVGAPGRREDSRSPRTGLATGPEASGTAPLSAIALSPGYNPVSRAGRHR